MAFTALRTTLPVLAACLLAVSCGSDDTPDTAATGSTAPSSTATTTTSAATTSTEAGEGTEPAGPVGSVGPARERVDWIVDLVSGPPVDRATVEAGFSTEFLAAVPYEQILAAAGVFASDSEWTIADDRLEPYEGEATLRSSAGSEVTVTLSVEEAAPHRITGLRFVPVIPEPFGPDETVTGEAIAARLAEHGPAAFGVFDVTDGTCRELAGDGTDRAMPVGSAFKLWILGALALEVEAGRAAWDEPFPVSDALKSSSDGQVSPVAAGTPLTLQQYAEAMISISDNSATDHLLARVGRQRVEEAMIAAGIADPAPNIPMLSTRELFLLKYADVIELADYLGLDAAGRRAVLDEQLAGVALADALAPGFQPTGPTAIDSLEWFATPADMCRTHVWLADLAERPGLEPVSEVLRLNPGLPFDARWSDVRFKGGSELGLVFGAWRISDADGRAFVIAGGVANPQEPVDDLAVVTLLTAATRLAELA